MDSKKSPLPHRLSPEFPAALRAAREEANLTRSGLAGLAKISPGLIKRYESPDAPDFSKPRALTWNRLNEVLGRKEPDEAPDAEPVLSDATIEEICAELKSRGASITLTF